MYCQQSTDKKINACGLPVYHLTANANFALYTRFMLWLWLAAFISQEQSYRQKNILGLPVMRRRNIAPFARNPFTFEKCHSHKLFCREKLLLTDISISYLMQDKNSYFAYCLNVVTLEQLLYLASVNVPFLKLLRRPCKNATPLLHERIHC